MAVGGLAIALGTGYYAYRAASDRDDARDRVAALEEEKQSLSDALELHRAARVQLDTQLTECKGVLTTEKTARVETDVKLTTCRSSVKDLKQQEADAKKTVAEFNGLTRRFQKMIDSGKLDVVFRRGEMVVKLPAQVLFSSGSATLSKDGKAALAEIARILRTMPRKFTVAGHTDNVPVKNADFSDNWQLSTARAVTVTSALIDHGVKPRNLVAAGYSQYAPLATNKTEPGRRNNRRIEIILEPDLRKLPLSKLASDGKRSSKRKRKR